MPKLMLSGLFTTLAAPATSESAGGAAGAVARAAAPATPSQFLFLLGTDTKFTPKPTIGTDLSYVRGETLSYAAQATAAILGEAETDKGAAADSPLSYSTPSVDVIDGPTTLGSEVGNRIAHGIFVGLKAAATGKTKLQITAHSRGAVEAILVMHELDRIKKALRDAPTKTLKAIMLESCCKLTSAAVAELFAEGGETFEDREFLATRLEALEVNPFLIDPVPGDTAYLLPYIGWHNPHFYIKPPCTHYELLLCANERTTCFYPIVPRDMKPTIIPGHHGTASGNQFTQSLAPILGTCADKPTTGVQDLVLYKWLHFQYTTTGLFGKRKESLPIVAHSPLKTLTEVYLRADEEVRTSLLIDTYFAVHGAKAAYDYFNGTSYSYLGRAPAPDGGRYIHNGSSALTSSTLITPALGGHFVNLEHAKLVIANSFKGFAEICDASIESQIEFVKDNFTKLTNTNPEGERVRTGLSDASVRASFFKGLSILVDSISQKYLRNGLNAAQKSALMAGIKYPFDILTSAIANEALADHRPIFAQCQGVLQDGIKKTIDTYFDLITQQYTQLQNQMTLFLAPPEVFNEKFIAFLTELDTRKGEDVNLTNIHARLAAISPVTIEAVGSALLMIENDESLSPSQKEAYTVAISGKQYQPLRAHFEAHQNSLKQYLVRIQELHAITNELKYIHTVLSPLLGTTKSLNFTQAQITLQCKGLKEMAGTLLHAKKHDLRVKPDSVSEEFFTIAKKKAINLGAPSPEARTLADRQRDLEASRLELAARAEAIAAQTALLTERDSKISALESDEEVRNAFLIKDKLVPLTRNYMEYLLTQAQRYSPAVTQRLMQNLPDIEGNDAYNKIKTKYDNARRLYQKLTAEQGLLPSTRLENFTRELTDCQRELKSPDRDWVTFSKACAAVLAIVATGIIPGLLALAAYSTTTGNSPRFFSRSNGGKFAEEAAARLSEMTTPRAG
jgi:hypothetical protein